MSNNKRVSEALKWASSFLKSNQKEASAAEWLMMHHLGVNRTEMLLKLGEYMQADILERFTNDVKRHVDGAPVQYIIGEQTFYGRPFTVNEEVLIPRPETEELIEEVITQGTSFFDKKAFLKAIDIGTGSGIIAVTLALEWQNLSVTATDIAEASLQIAKRNADNLEASIRFIQGDLLQPIISTGEKFDLIVSNPPYIPNADVLQLDAVVKDFEPYRALAGGEDGYDFYRRLMVEIPQVISPKGMIAFEVGFNQAAEVKRMLEVTFGDKIETLIRTDINGKDRIVIGKYNEGS